MTKSDLPIIGWLVNYNTTTKFSIKRDDLLKLMAKHDIPGNIAKKVLDRNAVIRSVRNTAKGILGKKLRFIVTDEKDVMVMAIAMVDSTANNDAKVKQVTKVVYDKKTTELTVEGEHQDAIKQGYENAKDSYESDQFRSIVLRYLKKECMAVNYLETGNIYVVATAKEDKLQNIAALFEDLGKDNCVLRRKEEYDTTANRTVMLDVAVGELQKEIEHHRKDFENQEDLTERGLAARVRKYKETELKAHMWGSVLQEKVDNLAKELDGLTKAVRKKLIVE
jgi:hypothetical protein